MDGEDPQLALWLLSLTVTQRCDDLVMAGKNDKNHLSRVPPHLIAAGVDLVLEVLCFYFLYKVVMCKYGSHPLVVVYQRRVKWILCLRGEPHRSALVWLAHHMRIPLTKLIYP